MEGQSPSEKQLEFLNVLDYRGPRPENKAAASGLIDALLRQKRP